MTELAPKGNLFNKSFEVEGRYIAQLKSGLKVLFAKREEIWKDKTACYWVTLEMTDSPLNSAWLYENQILYSREKKTQFDVRYNEISAIWEI